jgi:flagellar basal body-associated protein FliL
MERVAEPKVNFLQKEIEEKVVVAAPKPVKKIPSWILIFICSQIVIAVAVGLLIYFAKSSETAVINEVPAELHEDNLLFEVEPIKTNLVSSDETTKIVDLKLTFEVENKPVLEELSDRNSDLRDQLIGLIASKETKDFTSPQRLSKVKKEIMNLFNGLLKTGKITQVFFTDFRFRQTL